MKEWPKGGPKLLWHVSDIGDGYGTAAIAGQRIYVQSNKGKENEFVQALSVTDGKPIWTTRLGNVGNPDQQPPYPMARSTPTIDGDRLYAFSSDGDLASLQTTSGKLVWQKNVRRDFGGVSGTWAYAESPLIDGDAGDHCARRSRSNAAETEQADRSGDLEVGGAGRRSRRLFVRGSQLKRQAANNTFNFWIKGSSVWTPLPAHFCGATRKPAGDRQTSRQP